MIPTGKQAMTCRKCGLVGPESGFYRRRDTGTFRTLCKICTRSAALSSTRRSLAQNPAYLREKWHLHKARHPERCRAIARNSQRARRRADPTKQLEAERRYRRAHLERVRAAHKRWADKNPEWYRNKEQRRDAMSASLPATLTQAEWQAILRRYRHTCAYCGTRSGPLAQEHVLPLSRGGPYTKENIIPACKQCNSSKGNRTVGEWLHSLALAVPPL